MTAYNVIRLWCDRRIAGTDHTCNERFEVVAPGIEYARELAAKKGWTFDASPGADELAHEAEDYCPDHKPATEASR